GPLEREVGIDRHQVRVPADEVSTRETVDRSIGRYGRRNVESNTLRSAGDTRGNRGGAGRPRKLRITERGQAGIGALGSIRQRRLVTCHGGRSIRFYLDDP